MKGTQSVAALVRARLVELGLLAASLVVAVGVWTLTLPAAVVAALFWISSVGVCTAAARMLFKHAWPKAVLYGLEATLLGLFVGEALVRLLTSLLRMGA